MITAQELRKLSDGNIPFFEKKVIYGGSFLDELLKSKATSGRSMLIYTLYQEKLDEDEFNAYKQLMVKGLKDAGYSLKVITKENDFTVLKITWDGMEA